MCPSLHLTKSRYVAGLQCPKLLWWKVHEPDAPELRPDAGAQARFDWGHRVGEEARRRVPGGVLIDVPYGEFRRRLAATRAALDAGAKAVYEASFMADDVFVAVDILERKRGGYVLVEVKSTLDVKDEHLPDVAIQWHVLRATGLPVRRAEVMHLDRECRHPDLSNLFAREDVTERAEEAGAGVPRQVAALRAALSGPLPEVPTGPHCDEPYECPFRARCWPRIPKHHVSTLYRIPDARVAQLTAAGVERIADLPRDFAASGPMRRQIDAVRRRRIVVEPGLAEALSALAEPIAFLDFETVNPPIPRWPGCAPYEHVPVQMSCHLEGPAGPAHHEWLADGRRDPRPGIAKAVVSSCAGAATVLAYNATFERQCLAALAAAVPSRAADLGAISARLVDLLAIVRDHVYHPNFLGSFSLKSVLPVLVEGLSYDDLVIRDGAAAQAALERLLLFPEGLHPGEKSALRANLLAYCARDSLAMVRLLARLRSLAGLG